MYSIYSLTECQREDIYFFFACNMCLLINLFRGPLCQSEFLTVPNCPHVILHVYGRRLRSRLIAHYTRIIVFAMLVNQSPYSRYLSACLITKSICEPVCLAVILTSGIS
jgi:hypothetical protein